ncbi:type IX secretion system sortase PorU [Algoriphagus kandeliae]|uniref:Type IX secretion system sortase PorU n=1 Tax=Algoriphagus kandeliae TaxID=2562278 RepID=A0A4Y9QP82_9BACT|nr:type IX secretion system sortase PorU [Algoriphagus kandeliae]TFV94399.1 type IX secretion system sortase PorU [Algoriphagus kandeliae]
MRNTLKVSFSFLLLIFLSPQAWSQERFFKFPILENGIYQLSKNQLAELGFSDFSEVAFFGYPGRLPQKLDSSQLEWREIPSMETESGLLVFLTGPHVINPINEGIEYLHHYYSDTLYYLIGKKDSPKRVFPFSSQEDIPNQNQLLYQWTALKGEETNILNSGRVWYSKPVGAGAIQSIPIRKGTESTAPWKIQGKVMAQSLQASQISIIENGNVITSAQLAPIPNSTYGIKGSEASLEATFEPSTSTVNTIELGFESSDPNGNGYFEQLLVGVPFNSDNLDPGLYFPENKSSFSTNCTTCQAWEVSDFFNPKAFEEQSSLSGQKIIIFEQGSIQPIQQIESVENILLSNGNWPELLIITDDLFFPEAEKLSTHKMAQGIFVQAVSTRDIYDHFGYGNRDIVAIRNFLAWHFHEGKKLKNVLFLGKGTFDYKGKLGGRPSIVPTYSSRNSLNPLTTFSSDDFFGLLEIGQGNWEESQEGDETLSIGIGRLPVINRREAELVIKKIMDYESNSSFGRWKRNFSLFADDGDNNIHLRDAESHSTFLGENANSYFQEKLYLDRFEQTSDNQSQRSPEAKEKLLQTLEDGTLFLNFIGHGNETTLTAEEVFRIEDLANWPNFQNLPLWVTATCEFGRHDSPFIRSAAEELLIAEGKGAIGLLTTGRPVFSSVNFRLNEAFIQEVFKKVNGKTQDLGNIYKNTKNASLNGPLNRNFSLLGDPSMKLDYPDFEVKITEWKDDSGKNLSSLPFLTEITYVGEIVDPQTGNRISDFNGSFEIELRDKEVKIKTLGDESSPVEFPDEIIMLFRGSGKVVNGIFEGKFRLPEGLSTDLNEGRLRFYAVDSTLSQDASGGQKALLGGENTAKPDDDEGPEIKVIIENQSITPFIFPKNQLEASFEFFDLTGIDVSGLIPEYDLSIRINGGDEQVLNQRYISLDGSYQRGKVNYTLKGLQEGINTLEIKAADLLGNISTVSVQIEVRGSNQMKILDHMVFPNPANQKTTFKVSHNRPGENLVIGLEVYDMAGNILFSESERWVKVDPDLEAFSWIFLQSQSKIPAKGTYIYKLTLQSERDNSFDSISGKLIIE